MSSLQTSDTIFGIRAEPTLVIEKAKQRGHKAYSRRTASGKVVHVKATGEYAKPPKWKQEDPYGPRKTSKVAEQPTSSDEGAKNKQLLAYYEKKILKLEKLHGEDVTGLDEYHTAVSRRKELKTSSKAILTADLSKAAKPPKTRRGHKAYTRRSKKTGKISRIKAKAKAPRVTKKKALVHPADVGSVFLRKNLGKVITGANLPKGQGIDEALGVRVSLRPLPKGLKAKNVTIDLTGDIHTKPLVTWRMPGDLDKTYSYSIRFHELNASSKWEQIKKLDRVADASYAGLHRRMQDKSLDVLARDSAAMLWAISQTGLRIGRKENYDASGGKKRGVGTLHKTDVTVKGDTVSFKFMGKGKEGGKENTAQITDKVFATYVKAKLRDKTTGKMLWKALPHDGNLNPAKAAVGMEGFKTHNMRHLFASRLAAVELGNRPKPPPPMPSDPIKALRLTKKHVRTVANLVADSLNDTAKVARETYMNPAVVEAWVRVVGGGEIWAGIHSYLSQYKGQKSQQALGKCIMSNESTLTQKIWNRALGIVLPGADVPLHIPDEDEEEGLRFVLPF